MKFRLVPQISLFLKNQPGVMGEISEKLSKKKVNILGLSVDESTDWGVFRIIVNSLDRARRALHSFGPKALMVNKVLEVTLPNEPGQLQKVSQVLAKKKVNVNYAYASGNGGETALYLSVNDVKRAMEALK
ncbi:hypothetical protein HYW83_02590 [Candidatus Peregrinibacteria bacterium]|nr:hypothetical protein [Candidatus Peregrinibacteria bacterium]